MPPPSTAETARWASEPEAGEAWQQRQIDVMADRAKVAVARIAARLSAGHDAQQVAGRVLMGDIEGAALLASRSRDPVAYRIALSFCGRLASSPEAPHCALLRPERWAALDPADARPWLRLLDEARQRSDEAAVRRALSEIGARSQLSAWTWMLEAQVLPLLDLEPDPALRMFALFQVVGMDAAVPLVGMPALNATCRDREAAWPERMPLCRTAARQMLAAANDLLDATLAQTVAERSGVPRGEQAWDRATLHDMMTAYALQRQPGRSYACGTLQTWVKLSQDRVMRGELTLAHQVLRERPGR